MAISLFTILYLAFIVFTKNYHYSRVFHVSFLLTNGLALLFINIVRTKLVLNYRKKGGNIVHSALVVQPEYLLNDYSEITAGFSILGYEISKLLQVPIDSVKKKLVETIVSSNLGALFVINPSSWGDEIDEIIDIADDYGIRVKLLTPISNLTRKRIGFDTVGEYAIIDVRNEPLLYLHNRISKRSIDIVMALLSIVFVLTWLPIIVKIAQIISFPGPLFFSQERIGRNSKKFNIYKFRTMVFNPSTAELAVKGQAPKTCEQDLRVPWFGKLLRRTNLDEYPQFINVLLGTMSVVGPRPHMVGEDEELEKLIPKYRVRRFVKPGITGWAQINGYRGGTDDLELMKKRTEYDIWYLENWSLSLDIKIILITIWQMVTFRIPKAY